MRAVLLSSIAAVLPLLAGASTAAATTVVMQFDEVTGNYTPFDDTIGDSADADVSNRTRLGFGNATVFEEHVEHWNTDYSELVDVAFASTNGGVGELQFDVTPGQEIVFDSFRFGNYANGSSPRDVTFRIYDGGWGQVWQQQVTGHTGNSVLVSPNVTLTGTSYFQWGTDWNVGIDDFTYTTQAEGTVIPLPAGLPLLLAGLGAMALIGRRRRA
jgi:hypothetical protein